MEMVYLQKKKSTKVRKIFNKPQGEIIWKDNTDYPVTTMETMKTWSKEKYDEFVHFAYQVSETEFLGFFTFFSKSHRTNLQR
jgi:hypothetical protein